MQLLTFQALPSPSRVLWRFICHSNVFLGKMPVQGEPGYSGQDIVVYSVSNKRCASVSLSFSTSQCACVCAYDGALQYHKFMVIEMAESFGGKRSQFDSAAKRSHYSICTRWRTGATGKHLKANDLIKASQASPLTRCIKAIC